MALENALHVNLGNQCSSPVTCQEFVACFPKDTRMFFSKLFQSVDKHEFGVDTSDLKERLRILDSMPDVDKLRFILELQDDDGSGLFAMTDLKQSLQIWALSVGEETDHEKEYLNFILQALRWSLFRDDEDGFVGIDEILREVDKSQILSLLTGFKKHSANDSPRSGTTTWHLPMLTNIFSWDYLRYNRRKVFFVLALVLMNIVLVISSVCLYWHHSYLTIAARSSGNCLHFSTTLSVILMLRHSLTHLRTTRLAKYLPINQHELLHKIVGIMIVVFSAVHTACHTLNAGVICRNSTISLSSYLFTSDSEIGYFYGTAYPLGFLLLVILVVMATSSMSCVRLKCFQVFYYVHRLYVVFLIALLLHASEFWKWCLLPGMVLVAEKVWCSDVSKWLHFYKSHVTQASPLPNEVIRLLFARPERLRFQPGDFVFLQVPVISRFEWHPFTISSSPEDKDTFTCHVRNSGDWTGRLIRLLSEPHDPALKMDPIRKFSPFSIQQQQAPTEIKDGLEKDNPAFVVDVDELDARRDGDNRDDVKASSSHVRVYIDGPYGSATRRLFDADHVILVATGIGVTPYASVLQSIVHDYKMSTAQCAECNCTSSTGELKYAKLKKVDFVWINKDIKNLEWFETLLLSIEELQARHTRFGQGLRIHVHLYVTSDPLKQGMDPTSGVRYGRPNWEKLFREFKREGFAKTKVFFCGPSALAKVVKRHSMENHFLFLKEIF